MAETFAITDNLVKIFSLPVLTFNLITCCPTERSYWLMPKIAYLIKLISTDFTIIFLLGFVRLFFRRIFTIDLRNQSTAIFSSIPLILLHFKQQPRVFVYISQTKYVTFIIKVLSRSVTEQRTTNGSIIHVNAKKYDHIHLSLPNSKQHVLVIICIGFLIDGQIKIASFKNFRFALTL